MPENGKIDTIIVYRMKYFENQINRRWSNCKIRLAYKSVKNVLRYNTHNCNEMPNVYFIIFYHNHAKQLAPPQRSVGVRNALLTGILFGETYFFHADFVSLDDLQSCVFVR